MNAIYWIFSGLSWTVVSGVLWHNRRRLLTVHPATPNPRDAVLADWCRHMSLTVVTVSGAVFSTTFAELQSSEAPMFRNWNVPTQVTVWSDQADDTLLAEVPQDTVLQDEANG